MRQFIFGHDDEIAQWAFSTFNMRPVHYEMAIGILTDGRLSGAVLWHAFSGYDIEISYYGPKTMTLGIARACALVAIDHFGVSRVTARTSKANKMMTRGIKKIGFEYEGVRRHGYGDQDAIMYGLYGKNLARLAGKALH